MIQTRTVTLPHGISLQCRESGSRGRLVVVFMQRWFVKGLVDTEK
jgi:hypothetical protein